VAFSKIAYVTAAPGSGGGTTGNIDTSGADLIVAVIAYYGIGTPAAGDFTDSKSNTWNKRGNQSGGVGGSLTMFWSTPGTVGSGHNFTFSRLSTFPSILVIAFSGSNTASAFSQESAGAAPATNTSVQPGSLTDSTALGITGVCLDGSETGITINGSFTREAASSYGSGNNEAGDLAWKVFAAGAENPTWSGWSSVNNSARMWTFAAGTGGSAAAVVGPPSLPLMGVQ
jgi:hypothetical protein